MVVLVVVVLIVGEVGIEVSSHLEEVGEEEEVAEVEEVGAIQCLLPHLLLLWEEVVPFVE